MSLGYISPSIFLTRHKGLNEPHEVMTIENDRIVSSFEDIEIDHNAQSILITDIEQPTSFYKELIFELIPKLSQLKMVTVTSSSFSLDLLSMFAHLAQTHIGLLVLDLRHSDLSPFDESVKARFARALKHRSDDSCLAFLRLGNQNCCDLLDVASDFCPSMLEQFFVALESRARFSSVEK